MTTEPQTPATNTAREIVATWQRLAIVVVLVIAAAAGYVNDLRSRWRHREQEQTIRQIEGRVEELSRSVNKPNEESKP